MTALPDCCSPLVQRLTPYTPGEQPQIPGLIKLNTNENAYPPSPQAVTAMQAELGPDGNSLRRYPDPNAQQLKQAVARHFANYAISPDEVFVGNGSDEVLAHAFLAFFKRDTPLLMPDITYSFYRVYCTLYGIDSRTIPLDENLAIRVTDYREKNGGIILANPNAPTGRLLPLADIKQLAAMHPQSAVIIDEAYIDFGGATALALVRQHANLLIVRTLSKSHSLAGLRVGYAVGQRGLIDALERVKNSFNSYPLDRLAIAGACAALDDTKHLETTRQAVIASRTWLCGELEALDFSVIPSAANFVFARHNTRAAEAIFTALRQRKIIVRHFKEARIDAYLRISIGTQAECQALVNALRDILAKP